MTDKFPEMACITGKSSKESDNSTVSLSRLCIHFVRDSSRALKQQEILEPPIKLSDVQRFLLGSSRSSKVHETSEFLLNPNSWNSGMGIYDASEVALDPARLQQIFQQTVRVEGDAHWNEWFSDSFRPSRLDSSMTAAVRASWRSTDFIVF